MRKCGDVDGGLNTSLGSPRSGGMRSRRKINQQITVGNLDSGISSNSKYRSGRSSSNERSDYNIDESESEDGPNVRTLSTSFNPSINEKGGGIQRANGRSTDNPFSEVKASNSQFQGISPIKQGKKSVGGESVRPSDLEAFQTPFGGAASPIGMSSTMQKNRYGKNRQSEVQFDSDDDSDNNLVLDSDDLKRSRLRDDISPHNRNARPRSSCIKKDYNPQRRDSDLSTPKQVRFAFDQGKRDVEPRNLDNSLRQEVGINSSAPKRGSRAYPDGDEFVKEVSRKELQDKYGTSDDNLQSYNMGQRLRSNERLSAEELEHEREYQRNNKPRGSIEQAVHNSHATRYTSGRTTPPRSFQMRNIVNNTEYTRKKLPENRPSTNNTIAEMSSKYEDSREESSYHHGSPRARSPFNVSQTQNTSYVKENMRARRSPPRVGAGRQQHEYYEIDEGTTVLQQKPAVNNVSVEELAYRDSQRMSNRSTNPPMIAQEVNPNYVRPGEPMKQPLRYRAQDYVSPGHSPARGTSQERSPRRSPLGSPARRQKKQDGKTQHKILTRFTTNNLINKTVEDMIFELVPSIVQQMKNPQPQETVVVRRPSPPKAQAKPKTVKRDHQKELMNVMDIMDKQDEVSDDDTDERTAVNPVISSMSKRETKNHYVEKRNIDSLGIKFETNVKHNGVKAVPFQEKHNYPMIDVKTGYTRPKHEICDVWCADCFDLIREGQEEQHLKACRPFLSNKDVIEDKTEYQIVELPYVNEKCFKVSKAITQYLSEVLKSNAGLFDETVEIRFLRNLRQKAENVEKNDRNTKALNQMLESINQICYDSRNNPELYWVFLFSKRLSKLTDSKIEILENVEKVEQSKNDNLEEIRQTFADKSALRLTNVKDKTNQSINFDEVKSLLMSPYRRKETRVDCRFADLDIKEKNRSIRRIENSSSFSRLPM